MNAIDTALGPATPHDLNEPLTASGITDECACALDSCGRYISEADVWWTELCILRAKHMEIDDADVHRKFLLLAAEVRRLRHKLGEYDLTLLQEDLSWGDRWVERDIARATLDPKFRAYLSMVAMLDRAGRRYDPEAIQLCTGLSAEEVQTFGDRLSQAGIPPDIDDCCPADCDQHAPF